MLIKLRPLEPKLTELNLSSGYAVVNKLDGEGG